MCTGKSNVTMERCLNVWSHIAYYMFAVLVVIRAECPRDAIKRSMLCTASLGIGPPQQGPKAFVAMGEVEKAVRACRENELLDAVTCLEKIMAKCKGNTEREHILSMMIDTGNIRKSVVDFCENIDVYKAKAECIAEQHGRQENCTREVRTNFKTKSKATANMDVMITSTCRFFRAAVTCSSKILGPKCGNEARDIVVKMLTGFQPPKCLELEKDPSYRVNDAAEEDNPGNGGNKLQTISETSVFIFLCLLLQSIFGVNLELVTFR